MLPVLVNYTQPAHELKMITADLIRPPSFNQKIKFYTLYTSLISFLSIKPVLEKIIHSILKINI